MFDAGSGWQFQLQPVNYRPSGSFAFEVVRSGNVSAVRKLLDSGRLSVRDYEGPPEYGEDILTVRSERCEYLKRDDSQLLLIGCSNFWKVGVM